MSIVIPLGFRGMMPSSSATVLGNMMGKENEGMCVCWGGRWSAAGVSESDTRGDSDHFLDSVRILWFGGSLYISVWRWMVWLWWVVRSWVLDGGPWSYGFGVRFFFWGCFSLGLGVMEEWTSCGVVSMVDVIGGVFLGRGCRGWWRVLGEVTEVHVINIFIGIDFEDFFHNFSDFGRFLKEWKQWKGLDWPRVLISLSNTSNENTNQTFCTTPPTLTHRRPKHL